MCMKLECEIEEKPTIGWKIVETSMHGYVTPYIYMPIEIGQKYESDRYDPEENIYVFLNKIYAKKFLNWMAKTFGDYFDNSENFHLAKVRLGDHVWKGKIESEDGFNDLGIEYFFTTDSIEVLDIE